MSGHRLPPSKLSSVVAHIADGMGNSDVATATKVSRPCVRKIRLSLEYWGTPYPPRTVRLGRPSTLRATHRIRLREFLEGKPHAYLEEMSDFLCDEFDIEAPFWTVYRELERMRWSRKVASKRAKEQSEPLRRMFRARVAQYYTPEQIVAVDESACNERTGDRKYGWSRIGLPVELVYSFRRSERWSILPALTVDGYLNCVIHQGAITAEILEHFLQYSVLPYCTPYPGPNSVIVLDNASIHRSARVRELCEQAGVILEYLPPYSPDYNPIEKSFKHLKSWIKRHPGEVEQFEDFGVFLEYAVSRVCTTIDCTGWFRKCGYAAP
jgi:transposase